LKPTDASSAAELASERKVYNTQAISALIQGARSGDANCFEKLYHLYNQRVFGLCLRVLGDRNQAEDLVQEAFLQVHRKLHTYRGESQFSTWLHRLALNVVLMEMRKKSLRTSSLDQTAAEDREEGRPETQYGAEDHRLQFSLSRISLEHAITELPPGYRLVFILHDVQGYEHREIAEMMGCSLGNSKSQLHKARLRLRALLISPLPAQSAERTRRRLGRLEGR
jgi:RNA polymerase sigma-70 factor (ECF subfamily)